MVKILFQGCIILKGEIKMEKETKIILKWFLYAILLTITCVLIFFCLPWISEKIAGNLGIAAGTEAIFVMMLLFNWCFGMTIGFKLFCEELDKLDNTERTEDEDDECLENESKTSPKKETEI